MSAVSEIAGIVRRYGLPAALTANLAAVVPIIERAAAQ
jgi:hypothetical protein